MTGTLYNAHLIAPVITTTGITLSTIKSRMETFWYWLTQVHVEKWPLKRRERERVQCNSGVP